MEKGLAYVIVLYWSGIRKKISQEEAHEMEWQLKERVWNKKKKQEGTTEWREREPQTGT